MPTRRALLGSLLALASSLGLRARDHDPVTSSDSEILNRLMLHLLGLQDTQLILEPALVSLGRLSPFLGQAGLTGYLRSRYHTGTELDYEGFLRDVEEGRCPEMGFYTEVIRRDAVLAYYASAQGWSETGYTGVPVGAQGVPYRLPEGPEEDAKRDEPTL